VERLDRWDREERSVDRGPRLSQHQSSKFLREQTRLQKERTRREEESLFESVRRGQRVEWVEEELRPHPEDVPELGTARRGRRGESIEEELGPRLSVALMGM
jgi:hypothetical protein